MAQRLDHASRKETGRSVDGGRSFEGDSSRRKKRKKDLETHAVKMRREKGARLAGFLRGLSEGF